MVFAVTTWSLTVTNVKQLSNNAVYDQWSNHNHGRCLNSAKQMTKCIVQYDERQPEKKYCAQSCGILKSWEKSILSGAYHTGQFFLRKITQRILRKYFSIRLKSIHFQYTSKCACSAKPILLVYFSGLCRSDREKYTDGILIFTTCKFVEGARVFFFLSPRRATTRRLRRTLSSPVVPLTSFFQSSQSLILKQGN